MAVELFQGSADVFGRMGLVTKKVIGEAQAADMPRGMARICNAAERFLLGPRPPA